MFAKQKRQQVEELAARLHVDVPPEARAFFQAAEAGDYSAVSNCFEKISPGTGGTGTVTPLPSLKNVLYIPIHETRWAYQEFHRWDETLLQKYADGILRSVPAGSIYFGGTDPGRFIITAVRDAAQSPNIFIITQNMLGVSSHYTEYLRLLFGNRLWIPGEKDVQEVLQQQATEVKTLNGSMNIISALTKAVFDHNKDKHEFYVEESYVIPWMYAYLEPHGLILKLNKEPLAQLDSATVARDRQFWNALTKELLADPQFLGDEWARKTYAKLRSAIGGLYQNRHLTKEAEDAFNQAFELGPMSPEAVFRLAQLYLETNRSTDAISLLEHFKDRADVSDSDRQHILQAISQIRDHQHPVDETQPQPNPPSQ